MGRGSWRGYGGASGGLGFRVWGLRGLGAWGLRVQGLGFRTWDLGLGLGFRVSRAAGPGLKGRLKTDPP